MNKFNIVKLNTARNALRYIINAFNIKELYMPYYICPSVRICASKSNCKLIFYHIDKCFEPLCIFPLDAFILYPNYFGICNNVIKKLASKYKNLIVDNAHAFFDEPCGIASFNSLRKFFPNLRNGSFLYTTKLLYTNIEKDNFNYDIKKLSFEEICKNENILDNQNLKYMSDCTYSYFLNLNLEQEREKFISNFNENHKKFSDKNNLKLNIDKNCTPFKYPLLFNTAYEADNFAKECEKKGTVIYRYWNNLPETFIEKDFYTKLTAIGSP